MSELMERLRRHWMNQGIALRDGITIAQTAEFESTHGIILPDDFREYLLSISWPEDYEMDDLTISFWTINRIKDEYPLFQPYLPFADFLINSNEYAIKSQSQPAETSPVFFLNGEDSAIQISSSFTEFIERYLANDEGMLFQ